MAQCRYSVGVLGLVAMLGATATVADESRLDVLERIQPVGEVSIVGDPVPALALSSLPEEEAVPAMEAKPASAEAVEPAKEAVAVAAPAPATEAVPAAAATTDGAALYVVKGCAACHGPKGYKTLMPNYPKVAGQSKAYLVVQMKDIKSGTRGNGQSVVMKGIVSMVSDEEMDAIADWLSQQ